MKRQSNSRYTINRERESDFGRGKDSRRQKEGKSDEG